jgi:cell division septation protein DedD
VPKNEDGEFELILGNKQLFGVFFIVVLLFGVFFVMGYIVGENSTPLGRADVAPARKPETKPLVVDSPTRTPEQSAPAPEPGAPPVATAAQQAPSSDEKTKVEPQKPREPVNSATSSNQPAAGETYLQLAATAKTEADIFVDVLRKNGFNSIDYEMPEKPGRYRVLVGPIADGELNKMKADLQGKGFGNGAIKRTF